MPGVVTRRPPPATPATPPAGGGSKSLSEEGKGLAPSLFYLFIEFARPQAWVAPLGAIKPGMLAAAWGLLSVFTRKTRPIPRPMWAMFAFVLLMALNVPFAINNAWALWGLQDFAILIIGCVLPLVLLPNDLTAFRFLVSAYVFLHVPMAVHGLLHKGVGQGGWVEDENDLALALNAALGVAVFLFMETKNGMKRWALLGSIGLFVAAIIATLSRGGFLGLASLALVLLWLSPRRGTILGLLVVAIVAVLLFTPASYWKEMGTIETAENRGDTGEQRLYFWKLAWKIYLDHPVMGVGARNYGVNAPLYEDFDRTEHGFHVWGRVCHSLYFTLISEEGTVGIILFVYLVSFCFATRRKLRRLLLERPDDPDRKSMLLLATGIAAGMFGFLVSAAFLSALYYPVFWVLTGLMAGLAAVATESGGGVVAAPATK